MKAVILLVVDLLCGSILFASTHPYEYPTSFESSENKNEDDFDFEMAAPFPHKREAAKDEVSDISQLDPVLSAECEPITAVGGCVNVVSGQFFQIEKDLIGNSIEPLHLHRCYDSGSEIEGIAGFGYGLQYPLWASETQEGARHLYGLISEREGAFILYKKGLLGTEINGRKIFGIDPRVTKKRTTNITRAGISGAANLINRRAVYQSKSNQTECFWTLYGGDGSERIYEKKYKISRDQQKSLNLPTKKVYVISKEIRPNGNQLRYKYENIHDKLRLSQIIALNRNGKSVLDELHFHYSEGKCRITNQSGMSVTYVQENEQTYTGNPIKVLSRIKSLQKGASTYRTSTKKENHRIEKIQKQGGRFIAVEYGPIRNRGEQRVERILEPRGPHNETVETYRFQYEKANTLVTDGIKQRTNYHFDEDQRLRSIDYLDGNKIVRQDAFYWLQREGQEGWLKAKAVKLGEEISYLKSFRYDDCGNITEETTYGNISGEKSATFTMSQRESTDRYTVTYRYSTNRFNLPIEKRTPEGLVITYAYLKGTNLCIKELQAYEGKIQERIFRNYDENGQVEEIIEDDGSSEDVHDLTDVTFRKITTTQSVPHPGPSFGKPQWQKIAILDQSSGAMIPLNNVEFLYDSRGNQVKKRFYDSQNNFFYETTSNYDKHYRLAMESDAIGQETHYKYDESGNIIEKQFPQEGKIIRYFYDAVDRLKEKIESHDNGEVFKTTYTYNTVNQLITETDAYGHETSYAYDRLGRQTKIVTPVVQDQQGKCLHPTTKKKYNILNQMIKKTDENGSVTHFQYNIYGAPVFIQFADGATEKRSYYLSGLLKQQWSADGTSLSFKYNPKGRLIEKNYLDENGISLKKEEYRYKGPLLLSKKDAMGFTTHYRYDGAGRKIEERFNERCTRYFYDDFGNIVKIFRCLTENEGQYEVLHYDGLKRITAREWQDAAGILYAKESFSYDAHGNQVEQTVWQSDEKSATSLAHFNSDGTQKWKKDPLGNRTTWDYHHAHINGIGQRVQCRTSIDPLGRIIGESEDTHHRLVRRDRYEGEKQLSCTHYDYDLAGNLIRIQAQVKAEGVQLRTYGVQTTYNKRGWKISEMELPSNSTTQFSYDSIGRLIEKIKPDGVKISYRYDALGRLKEKYSSDNSFSYTYAYDLNDNIQFVEDNKHNKVQKRLYDPFNRLIKEELFSGIIITYSYDSLDRLTKLMLPCGSYIAYTYDAFHLKKIDRFNEKGECVYSCDAFAYDFEGCQLRYRSPAGLTNTTYDLLGRVQKIDTLHWKAFLDQYDAAGNLKTMQLTDPDGTHEGHFSYDHFDHLTEENLNESNQFTYDSIGNCLKVNGRTQTINALNQLIEDGNSNYTYDLNGNLTSQSNPPVNYFYDALNRLIRIEREGKTTSLLYDAFNRLVQIQEGEETKHLLYHGMREIGSLTNGNMKELRLMHPHSQEHTYALELNNKTYFPIQDFRHTIAALQTDKQTLAQWYHFTAFGLESVHGEPFFNPWRFGNKREIEGLSLFANRFYHPQLRRWLTKDPLGFEDGLHQYAYVHNNPMRYADPDGQFAFALPITITVLEWSFGAAAVASAPVWFPAVGATVAAALVVYGCNELYNHISNKTDDEALDEEEDKGKASPRPPYCGEKLGDDPNKCPGEGFEWRGNGTSDSGKGSWVRNHGQSSQESLHPDFDHPPPKKPHWDYEGPDGRARLNTDGTWEWK